MTAPTTSTRIGIGDVVVAGRETVVGHCGAIDAQVEGLGAGAACETHEAQAPREVGRHPPRAEEAVLQARMLVKDVVQLARLAGDPAGLGLHVAQVRGCRIRRHAAGNDAFHHEAMAEH